MRREIALEDSALGFRAYLKLAGAICQVTCNSHIVVGGLRTWQAADESPVEPAFSLRVFVEPGSPSRSAPHFRGRQHLVIASFGVDNVLTFDLSRRSVTCVVTPQTAADQPFWDRVLLPITMGVLGPAFGVVPVHSACLVHHEAGILIAGESGAGKSTLSVALAQQGLGFVSDDWTYLSLKNERLVAHGLSVPAKLLPDAVRYFPVLARFRPSIALNQELAYELSSSDLGTELQLSCEPKWFFFLERSGAGEHCEILPISSQESRQYVSRSVERLPSELDDVRDTRAAVIAAMPNLSCWKLTYGGPPTIAVQGLTEFLASQLCVIA